MLEPPSHTPLLPHDGFDTINLIDTGERLR